MIALSNQYRKEQEQQVPNQDLVPEEEENMEIDLHDENVLGDQNEHSMVEIDLPNIPDMPVWMTTTLVYDFLVRKYPNLAEELKHFVGDIDAPEKEEILEDIVKDYNPNPSFCNTLVFDFLDRKMPELVKALKKDLSQFDDVEKGKMLKDIAKAYKKTQPRSFELLIALSSFDNSMVYDFLVRKYPDLADELLEGAEEVILEDVLIKAHQESLPPPPPADQNEVDLPTPPPTPGRSPPADDLIIQSEIGNHRVCKFCSGEFRNFEELENHFQECEELQTIQPLKDQIKDKNEEIITLKHAIQEYRNQETEIMSMNCKYCSVAFVSLNDLQEHFKNCIAFLEIIGVRQ